MPPQRTRQQGEESCAFTQCSEGGNRRHPHPIEGPADMEGRPAGGGGVAGRPEGAHKWRGAKMVARKPTVPGLCWRPEPLWRREACGRWWWTDLTQGGGEDPVIWGEGHCGGKRAQPTPPTSQLTIEFLKNLKYCTRSQPCLS